MRRIQESLAAQFEIKALRRLQEPYRPIAASRFPPLAQ